MTAKRAGQRRRQRSQLQRSQLPKSPLLKKRWQPSLLRKRLRNRWQQRHLSQLQPQRLHQKRRHRLRRHLRLQLNQKRNGPAFKSGAYCCYQPFFAPLFCALSHFMSGAKYSSIGLPDISRVPVNACNASGQGFDAPISSIAFNRVPTSLFP